MLPGSSLLSGALLALGLLAPLSPAAAQAGGGATTLAVAVRGSDGRPLAGAQVQLPGLRARAVTDASGRARLDGLRPGSATIIVQLLGYSTERATMILPLSGAAEASFTLEPQPVQLAAVRVRAAPPLPLVGTRFYSRRKAGIGTFLTRAEIESARPRSLSDFLRGRVAGVDLTPAIAGTAHASMRGNVGRDCPIQFYLDGVQTLAYEVDDVKPYDVEGLEIYRGAASVPVIFNKGTAACGAIVVWTKGR
jgi:hypothetical protein